MLQKHIISLFFLTISLVVIGQNNTLNTDINSDYSLKGYVSGNSFLSNEDTLPFWMYTNTNNTIGKESTYSLRTGLSKQWTIGDSSSILIGGGLNLRDGVHNHLQVEELYASYINKLFSVDVGVKHRNNAHHELSSINGDILWTGNARSIPGALLKTTSPISIAKWLAFNAELGHYELNDDRFVDKARIHYKSLAFIFKVSENQNLTAGLAHYVQWAGISPEFGKQASGFKNYLKVFLGQSGGNQRNDQINTIGNHLGSYQINYHIDFTENEVDFYYQSIFEDRSGRELNNFPDGVWGVSYKLKENTIINTLLLEYIQTVSQSGRPRQTSGGENQQSGGDNYFSNSIYRSGWTYQGNIIGLPFIIRNANNTATLNNRSYALNIGAAGSYNKFDYSLKTTLVKNLGTYATPFDVQELAIYTYGKIHYNTAYGAFNLQAGLDYSDVNNTNFGAGLGYQYNLN